MKMLSLEEELKSNAYPGRGLVICKREICGNCLLYHGQKPKQQKSCVCGRGTGHQNPGF